MSESAIDIAAAGDAPANAADDVGGDSEKNESNKAASPSSNASCLKKYRFQFPVFNDMVEDIVRTRLLGVILITTVYVVVAFSAISLVKPGASAPSTIQTSSLFPAVATMRAKLAEIRAPRFRLLDKDRGEFPGASFSVTIAGVYQLQTRGTLDCNTETLNHFSVKDTMEGTRVAAACAPVMAGDQAGRGGGAVLGAAYTLNTSYVS